MHPLNKLSIETLWSGVSKSKDIWCLKEYKKRMLRIETFNPQLRWSHV